VEEPGR